jgi:membrane protease subunit (stomatin/prohibitin family)
MAWPAVISTLDSDGCERMGPTILMWHYPSAAVVSGSLLTVESNHLCILKSRGAILNVYEMGQYALSTGDKPIIGTIASGFFGGTSPWQFEVIYVNKAKLVGTTTGTATSAEMAEMSYEVDYYVHVLNKDGALKLIQHMPYAGNVLQMEALDHYAKPVIEQAINKIVQVTPLEMINEKIQAIRDEVHAELEEFLIGYGITLDTIRVVLRPADERMRSIISLKALGIKEEQAVRYYLAMVMAERGVISAPNMAVGAPFHIGGYAQTALSVEPPVRVPK